MLVHRLDPVPAPGVTFEGRYEILAKLGEGGFGSVHKARQLATGQAVALKIMHLPALGEEARREKRIARFLREMQLCAQLHHPNIVQLVDSGRTEGGLLYTVFALAPGDNLADLLAKEGALAPKEARYLMLQVLDALACAHAEGVVHRDLKPRNIVVIPTGARRNAVVLDFGIGALLDGDGPDVTRLTATSETLGTPGYAAPEQWRGSGPTPRADVFSWGLVLIECLTGKPVYSGGSGAEIVYQQLGPEPVPIPPELEGGPLGELLRAATRKDPAARDVTARGLLEALEACDLRDLSPGVGRRGPTPSMVSAETIVRTGASLEGERRQVTAVCCNLSVEPIAPASLAPEAQDEILCAGLALSAEIARRHRGHTAATLGDELLVYFGYPRAEEDDAPRAARAALAIASAIDAENERLGARGVRIEVKIGVHAGLVVAKDLRDARDVALTAGRTPRLASRLARLSPPGGVLVTTDTHRLLRGAFELEPENRPSIEGGGGAVKVFRLTSGERNRAPTPEGVQPPFVGRAQEIDLLLDRWRRARAGGGQSAFVTGEPGIGKSRLLRELRERLANEPHTFVEGRCSPDTRDSALYPIVDLLGRALGLDRERSTPLSVDRGPDAAGKVALLAEQLARHGLTPAEAMPLFLPLFSLPLGEPYAPLDVSPQKQKELTLNAILALLFAMAEERPVLFLVEDLHWADPTTLELLGQLVREAPSSPMCLLLTARPEFSPAFPTTGMLQLHLNRLERAQIDAMVAEIVGGKALPPLVLEQVASRTDGVPLFVEELTRMMVDSGALIERADRYELAGALADVQIPSTLRALLTARLDRLGRAKETAQLAAALGREFSVEVMEAVSPLGAAGVQEDLDRLMGAGLVFRKRRMRDPGGVFKHALVRDAAYESLPGEARRRVHARIAGVLEERFPAMVEARPEVLALHLTEAGQIKEAVEPWHRAGRMALDAFALVESMNHLRRALGLLKQLPDSAERLRAELSILLTLSAPLTLAIGFASPDVRAHTEALWELCGKVGDGAADLLFPALYVIWQFYHVSGTFPKAQETAERLHDLARRTGDSSALLAACTTLGATYLLRGRIADARTQHEEGLRVYAHEEHGKFILLFGMDFGAMCASLLTWTCAHECDDGAARAAARRALDICAARSQHPGTCSFVQCVLATYFCLVGDHESGVAAAEACIRLGREQGMPHWVGQGQGNLGWALSGLGRLDEAAEQLDQGIASMLTLGSRAAQSYFWGALAEVELRRGRFEEALAVVDRGLDYTEESDERFYEAELRRLRGRIVLARGGAGAQGEALAELQRALSIARLQGAHRFVRRAEEAIEALDAGAPAPRLDTHEEH
ncbi:TOMM system kinase/cyclase fusion protein [Sorangium sp. So ce1128]